MRSLATPASAWDDRDVMRHVGWLVVAACGRIGFDPGGASSDGGADAVRDDTSGGAIAWRQSFAKVQAGQSSSVSGQAMAVNDLVIFHVDCGSGGTPTVVTVTAPGWTFTQIAPTFGGPLGLWTAVFVGYAPDTAPTTITAQWTGLTCTGDNEILGDEFANADVDAHAETTGTGDCVATVASSHANDAVWAACASGAQLAALGTGYTLGADDGTGDWSEYKLTTDPAGTNYTVTFANGGAANAMTAATLQPR
jgi:hypothetical protein